MMAAGQEAGGKGEQTGFGQCAEITRHLVLVYKPVPIPLFGWCKGFYISSIESSHSIIDKAPPPIPIYIYRSVCNAYAPDPA